MNLLWVLSCILLVVYVAKRLFFPSESWGGGRTGSGNQPDHVHLRAIGAHPWRDEAAAESTTEALLESGFQDAGTYRIPELDGTIVRLLANPADSLYANLYEHPRAGFWFEIVARYQDHKDICFTTARPTGVPPRPDHRIVHAPGVDPFALYDRVHAQMPEGALRPAMIDRALHDFEEAYAEAAARRKAQGGARSQEAAPARRKAA